MSSPGSPALIVETSLHRTEAAAMTLVVGGGVLAPWLVDPLSLWAAALLSLAAGSALSLGFLQAGWWGGRRVVRLSWSADGLWRLTLRNGRAVELDLHPQTRVASGLLWLRWRPAGVVFPRRAMLLSRLDIPPGDLRRLVTRLRLDAPAALRGPAPAVVGA
jgi:hypothetical protein